MIKLTGFVILGAIILLGAYDTFAFLKGGTEATISHVLLMWSYDYPIFTFSFGVLVGHLFWRTRDTGETKRLGKTTDA